LLGNGSVNMSPKQQITDRLIDQARGRNLSLPKVVRQNGMVIGPARLGYKIDFAGEYHHFINKKKKERK
jgi:hypothetical protein